MQILRRNWHLENDVGRMNSIGYGVGGGILDEDRNALTPGSIRLVDPICFLGVKFAKFL